MSAFSVFFMQSTSFLEFQRTLQSAKGCNNASTLFGLDHIASDNHIRSMLDPIPPSELSPMSRAILTALDSGGHLATYRSTRHDLLVALDATQYFSSSKIHGEQCNTQHHDNDSITYSHTAITPIILAPGHPEVIALEPEFITPQDGHEKQDGENTAAKRWLEQQGSRLQALGITILGDDLYCKQPLCQAILDQGLSFILVCKPKSHTTLYEWVDGLEASGGVQTHQVSYRKGKHHYTDTYRFVNAVPLKAGEDALEVNWCELSSERDDGVVVYKNAFATNHLITPANVVDRVRDGRARWKIESVPQAHEEMTNGSVMDLCKSDGEDGGRPAEVGYQEQASNPLKRLLLKVMVVSVEEKLVKNQQVRFRKMSNPEPLLTRR